MADYDFSTINASDLENLTCDLLNAEQPTDSVVRYKTFKDGKDKGIDFLFSSEKNIYEQVGQVKHYLSSGSSQLISKLKASEVKKVKILNPEKYIVSTSVDLSVTNTKDIMGLFSPFIKSLSDIYGKKDLNRLIQKHPEVLEAHFKLWFSNTEVFRKLLSSNLEFRSVSFIESEIKRRLRIYVKTAAYDKARVSLKKNKFIVITGEPGVGKTTLAEMLAFEYIKEDYKLIYIYDSIRETDNSLLADSSKQIIYFDDFLGSNEVEINRARGSDSFLNKILRRISSGTNKLLIFTTRKHILNRAIQESEKLKRFNILTGDNIVHLDDYTDDIKENLFINHIEDSQLPIDYIDALKSNEIFYFVLNHSHFSPRAIEYITSKESVKVDTIEKFKIFVKESLNNPAEIWKHAYNYQLIEDDKLLLNTLLSFGDEVSYELLNKAFDSRLDYEIKNNNKIGVIHAFSRAYHRLIGGFLYSTKEGLLRFINPSLLDFLLKYIREDKVEVHKITSSIITVQQLTKRLFSLSFSSNKPEMPLILEQKLLSNHRSFLTGKNSDGELILLALVGYKYINPKFREKLVCKILNEIEHWDSLHENYELSLKFQDFMMEVRSNSLINNIIESKIIEIINGIVLSENDIDIAIEALKDLIAKYHINLFLFNTYELDKHFTEILDDYISEEVYWLRDQIQDESESDELLEDIKSKIVVMQELGINVKPDLKEITGISWYEEIQDNEFKRKMEDGKL